MASPLAHVDRELVAALPGRGLVEVDRFAHDLARHAHRDRGVLGDPRRDGEGLVDHVGRGHDPVHEAEVVRPTRVDRVAGHRQLERDGHRDPLRQANQAPGDRHQAPFRLGDPELGGLGGHDDVAREHDLEAPGECGPVDRGDERLGEVASDDAGEIAFDVGDVHCAA